MIFDQLNNAGKYALAAHWQQAFAYLQTLSPDAPEGEFALDGEHLFAKVLSYDTRKADAGKIESHRRYADIQVCLVGAEGIDLFYSPSLAPLSAYDDAADLQFYNSEGARQIGRVDLWPGHFCILYPDDAHRPQMIVGPNARTIKKAVVKVELSE